MKQERTDSKGFPFQPNHTHLKPAQVPAAVCEYQHDWPGTVRARFVTKIDFLNKNAINVQKREVILKAFT